MSKIIPALEYDRKRGLYREIEVKKSGSAGYIWSQAEGMRRDPWKLKRMSQWNTFARYNRMINKFDAPEFGRFLFLLGCKVPYFNIGMDDYDPIFCKRQRIFFPLYVFDAAKCVCQTLYNDKTQSWKRGGISCEGYRVTVGAPTIMAQGKNGSEPIEPFYMLTMPDKYIAWAFYIPDNGPYTYLGKPIEIRHCCEVHEYERYYEAESENGEDRAERCRLPRPFPLLTKKHKRLGK
ncbi:hypothetical protein [Cloacibacillus porcorum]